MKFRGEVVKKKRKNSPDSLCNFYCLSMRKLRQITRARAARREGEKESGRKFKNAPIFKRSRNISSSPKFQQEFAKCTPTVNNVENNGSCDIASPLLGFQGFCIRVIIDFDVIRIYTFGPTPR